jgi:predicted anti-sigma-YlaC factor YlaD
MHCRKTRKRLQEWFDQPVAPLPSDVAAHVKECTDCRALVTRWNAIELQIQAMKSEEISPSADIAASVRKRLREPDIRAPWRVPVMAWRLAGAGAAAMVAAAALFYVLGGMRILTPAPSSGTAAFVDQPGGNQPVRVTTPNK